MLSLSSLDKRPLSRLPQPIKLIGSEYDILGCWSPNPQQQGRCPASAQVSQCGDGECLTQYDIVGSCLLNSDDSVSQCSTCLISEQVSPCTSQCPLQHESDGSAADVSSCDVGSNEATKTCRAALGESSLGASASAAEVYPQLPTQKDHAKTPQKLPRLQLSSLRAGLQEGVPRDRRGGHSPDPRRRPMDDGEGAANTITILSIAGEVLCTLDGSAKRSTTRELKFLIKDLTGILVDYQELLHEQERLLDWPCDGACHIARPLMGVRGPLTLTLVKSEPLPSFRALI